MLLYLLRHGEKVINLQIKKRGKIIAEVFNYIDEANYAKSSAELVNRILKNVPYIKSIGYAGWKSKKSLMQNLNWSIGKKIGKIKKVDLKVIKEAVLACNKFICKRKVYIFIFPTFDEFILNKMDGVSGYTIYKNTIAIYINTNKNYKKALKETLVHEMAHVISDYYNKNTLKDALINEGLAEHFREYLIGGGKAKWVKSISKKEALLIFKKIKPYLNKSNDKLYRELFLGGGRYPLWAGYAIGYYLIDNYLKKQKIINWNKILK